MFRGKNQFVEKGRKCTGTDEGNWCVGCRVFFTGTEFTSDLKQKVSGEPHDPWESQRMGFGCYK